MQKQLVRSRKHRMISGVAGGIAEYFDIDPVIVRAIFIIATFGWGFSILAYIILWIIVPDEYKVYGYPDVEPVPNAPQPNVQPDFKEEIDPEEVIKRKEGRRKLAGIGLISVGAILLLNTVGELALMSHLWPLVLVAIGIYILYKNRNYKHAGETK